MEAFEGIFTINVVCVCVCVHMQFPGPSVFAKEVARLLFSCWVEEGGVERVRVRG